VRWLDFAIIAVYMCVLAGIGVRFSRRQTSTERYFVAKRSIPAWAMGLSLLATLISSVTFIAYPGSAYAADWSNLVPGLTVIPVLLVTVFVVIPFFRHVIGMSAYEYFGKRFGYPVRVYASIAYALGHFSKMGFVFYLLALTAGSMTGWRTEPLILLAGVVTIGYTLIGGIEAVIWADVIQGFVLWFGIAICLGYLLFLPPGGPAAMFHAVAASHKITLGSFAPDLTKPTVLTLGLYGFFYYLQRYSADQTVIQRYLVAKSDRGALRGVLLGSLLCIPVWTLFMLIGTLCWAFYKVTAEVIPAYASKSDQVFPYFITTHVPPGLAGLFLAGLFGAAMANLSSDFNSLSAVFVEDYYRVWNRRANDRQRLAVGKIVVAVSGCFCVMIAIVLAHTSGSALSLWYMVSAIVSAGLAGLFLLAFLVPRAGAQAAQIAIVACLLFTAWATLYPRQFGLHVYMVGVAGHLIIVMGGAAASVFFPNRDQDSRNLTLRGWRQLKKQPVS
jgi:SSS family solute:Na+ symporter